MTRRGYTFPRWFVGTITATLFVALVVNAAPAFGAPAPGVFEFTATSSSEDESAGTIFIGVTLTLPGTDTLNEALTVNLTTGGSAIEDTHYSVTDGSLDFDTSSTDGASQSFELQILDDTFDGLDGGSESAQIVLGLSLDPAPTLGSSIGTDDQHVVTINDDDSQPTVSVSDESGDENETPMVFDVTLSSASNKDITVDYATSDDTALAGSDYTSSSSILTFDAGDTSKTFPVTIINNGVNEPTESFDVTLTPGNNVSAGDTGGIGTIFDDDGLPALSVSDDTVTEGGTAEFTVTLSPASGQTVTVDYTTSNGTAVAPGDYTAVSTPVELTFTPGQTSKLVQVTTIDDALDENNGETFDLVLADPSNASISAGTGTASINDNDPLPALSTGNSSILEGAGPMVFTVNLSTASGRSVSIPYSTSNGTATAADYTGVSDTLTFSPGSTSETINVPISNDLLDEPPETIILSFGSPTNATYAGGSVTGTINDNDPTPALSVSDPTEDEGDDLTFTVSLSSASGRQVTVDYATSNGSAVAPADYGSESGTLTFNPGETSKNVVVSTVDDSLDEPNETFTLVLSDETNATLPASPATGTIRDLDGAPGLSISDALPVVEGAGSLQFEVSLLPMSGQVVTAAYTTVNGTAIATSDYTETSGTVTFTPGQTSQFITVPVIDDSLDEVAESMSVTLSDPVNADFVGTPAPATVTATGSISDNDNVAPSVSSLSTTDVFGTPQIQFDFGENVVLEGVFADAGAADVHTVSVDWGDGTAVEEFIVTPTGTRTFQRSHSYASLGFFTLSVSVTDGDGGVSSTKTSTVVISLGSGSSDLHNVGLVDPTTGKWYLYDNTGLLITTFYYGNPGDFPIFGDWDGDGIETPGMYRQSDGFVYLRNSNTQGVADIRFFFGNPGDVPIAGDFDNDGADTVSIYRPSNQTFYIINELGENEGGLGAADFFYVFGNPGDKPFVGDFDGDGVETVGLHRESTGLVYFRNSHTQGNADNEFIYGDPLDRLVAGDWNGDGAFSPALFRPSNRTMYFRFTNTQGNADNQFVPGPSGSSWLPVSGRIG